MPPKPVHPGKVLAEELAAIANGLDIATTAEGVETKEQFDLLRAAGVTSVQGYLFGRAVPASELDLSRSKPLLPREFAA